MSQYYFIINPATNALIRKMSNIDTGLNKMTI